MIYRTSPDAESDLLSIWDFTARKWSEAQADLYIEGLVMRFAWLTQNKELWKSRPEIGENLYSYTEKSHVIIFREYSQGIEFLRILHGRMDLKQHI